MHDEIAMFDSVIVGLVWLARDFMIVTLVITGLASVVLIILNRLRMKLTVKTVSKPAVSRPSKLSRQLRRLRRRKLVAAVVIESIIALVGCIAWDQGLLFSRLQATGLLILSLLFWVSTLLVRRRVKEQEGVMTK
jgi:hypothetical protein